MKVTGMSSVLKEAPEKMSEASTNAHIINLVTEQDEEILTTQRGLLDGPTMFDTKPDD